MSQTEQAKGIFGLITIWGSWLIGHLSEIKEGVSILASIAAILASFIYARYWLIKERRER